jgi:hypothetical protein
MQDRVRRRYHCVCADNDLSLLDCKVRVKGFGPIPHPPLLFADVWPYVSRVAPQDRIRRCDHCGHWRQVC